MAVGEITLGSKYFKVTMDKIQVIRLGLTVASYYTQAEAKAGFDEGLEKHMREKGGEPRSL